MNLNLNEAQIKCLSCGEIYYQTTDLYDPKKILTGEMLEWIPRYGPDGLNWSLPFAASDLAESIQCEQCGSPIAPTGFLGLDRLHFPAGEDPAVYPEGEIKLQPVEDIVKFGVQSMVLDGNPDPETAPEIEKEEEEPIPPYLDLKSCPDHGGFFNLTEWENHLANHHTLEERARISAKPEPIKEENTGSVDLIDLKRGSHSGAEQKEQAPVDTTKTEMKQDPGKGKGRGRQKIQAELDLTPPSTFPCPVCDKTFDEKWQFQNHVITHDMGNIQQVSQNDGL